jgi:hypothetical protein
MKKRKQNQLISWYAGRDTEGKIPNTGINLGNTTVFGVKSLIGLPTVKFKKALGEIGNVISRGGRPFMVSPWDISQNTKVPK